MTDQRVTDEEVSSEVPEEENERYQTEESKYQKEQVQSEGKIPTSIYYILGYVFCEKFAFYGTGAILVIYLSKIFRYDEDTATMMFHFFQMVAFFTPALGAVLADSWIGIFWTIFSFSVFYGLGSAMISIGSIPSSLEPMKIVLITGLVVVGIGAGGIKPCIAAFGGNQFSYKQAKSRVYFFSIYYFVINSGSFCGTILMPILRSKVNCFGSSSCFPLAFGVPALSIILSITIFVVGKPVYKVKKPESNIIMQFFGCICCALNKRMKGKEMNKCHWLDYAEDKYDKKLIEDSKYVLHVWILLLPVPVFWALFFQQNSRWTLQATKLSGDVYFFSILPDQMKVLNSALVLIFIPLFDYLIYPAFEKCYLLRKPLQRMTTGGFLAAFAFLLAGILELTIEARDESETKTQKKISILFQVPQYVFITMGEIMLSIQGLAFCYSQAPISMKSVLQASWLLTAAFGNLFLLLITKFLYFKKYSWMFFTFSLIMAFDMGIFAVLAYFYKYVEIETSPEESVEPTNLSETISTKK